MTHLTSNELNEFRNLVKESVPIANREKENTSRLHNKTISRPNLDAEPITEPTKNTTPPLNRTEPKKIGRPSKSDSEKVKTVNFKCPPDELIMLMELPFGEGLGSKIRHLLKEYRRLIKIEKDQFRPLIHLAKRARRELDRLSNNYQINSEKNQEIIAELMIIGRNCNTLLDVLSIPFSETKKHLMEPEYRALDFATNIALRYAR